MVHQRWQHGRDLLDVDDAAAGPESFDKLGDIAEPRRRRPDCGDVISCEELAHLGKSVGPTSTTEFSASPA
jgi:hypothetical protein